MKSILVSQCLLGEKVRYDGGDCLMRDDYLARLRNKFNLITICPEIMAGMGVPREPIELKNGKIVNKNGDDLTDLFIPVKKIIKELIQKHNIKYALLKEFSPSCGSTKIYNGEFEGQIIVGVGLIAKFCIENKVQVFSEETIDKVLDAF